MDTFKESMMRKLLMVATLGAAALATTPLLADQAEHRHGASTGAQAGADHKHGAQHAGRHAEMQERMQERHEHMATRQHGHQHGAQDGHRGGNNAEGCPMHRQDPKA
jgi:hypothetical protein